MGVAGDTFEVFEFAGLANEETQLRALGGEGARYVMADESGCASDEDSHAFARL